MTAEVPEVETSVYIPSPFQGACLPRRGNGIKPDVSTSGKNVKPPAFALKAGLLSSLKKIHIQCLQYGHVTA